MASFNEYSIGRFGLCLNRNRDLLTRLFQASEPVYYSQVVEDDAYKNCDINELIDLHIVNILGKEMLSLTPEFHEMISKAFSLGYLVSDHDVMRYKEKLESDIEDCNASKDFRHDIYLRRVKNDIGGSILSVSSIPTRNSMTLSARLTVSFSVLPSRSFSGILMMASWIHLSSSVWPSSPGKALTC